MHFPKSMRTFTATICCISLVSQICVFGQSPSTAPTALDAIPISSAPFTNAPVAVATPVPPLNSSLDDSTDALIASKSLDTNSIDVELSSDHSLVGKLVGNNGAAIPTAPVEIWQHGRLVQTSMTDDDGAFSLQGLSGGTYEINFGDRLQPTRCWTPGAAPPHALTSIRIVADEEVVRAQQRRGAVCGVVNPWIIAGVAVAAIVIPVALHNNRADRPASN